MVWARDATDFRPSMNGVGGACASRRTVWESGRERSRDGAGVYRTVLRVSGPSVVARILAWARDATDFRPSRNGVGGACASRRTVWASGRERWCDGAGCYRTLAFRRTHHNTCPTRALTECNCHPFTLTRPLGRRFGVPERPVSDACMCMQSTCHTPCNASTGRARPP